MHRTERVPSERWQDGAAIARPDDVVVEEPLTIHVEHRGAREVLGSTMRTPGDDQELAVGLAVAEGLVRDRGDVAGVMPCIGDGRPQPNDVLVVLDPDRPVDLSGLGRVGSPTSACGICGRDALDTLARARGARVSGAAPAREVLATLPEAMTEHQRVFRRTGGLHAAALADRDGHILVVREDVGRHNAVDKVIGHALLGGLSASALVVSGRAGFEIVQKAVMAGIPALVSVSATTSLAVDAARDSGLLLACFAREGRMTVYSAGEDPADTVAQARAW